MEETIKEEYTGYVNSVPKHTVELYPLKFWAVSIYKFHSCYIPDIYKKKLQDKPQNISNSL